LIIGRRSRPILTPIDLVHYSGWWNPVIPVEFTETIRTMPRIPSFILDRLRDTPPGNCGVVPHSTPVISFGNPATAQVATLGLNPSKHEFLDSSGGLLQGEQQRFATLKSLRRKHLADADHETLREVVEACHDYFSGNPYERWFRPLDQIVQAAGASFFTGTACHLDLVQWATDPVWGQLPKATRGELLNRDGQFLMNQLRHFRFPVLLLNGSGVIDEFKRQAAFEFDDSRGLSGPKHRPARLSYGRWENRLLVIGWSCNLQSSHGVTTELREEIADAVRRIVRRHAG
jgi:hypothetical protein